MPSVPFHNLGLVGIIRDQAAHELPPEAWSDGLNVRFQDNKIIRSKGYEALFGTPQVAPLALQAVPTPVVHFWMYMGTGAVYVVQGTTHTDITKAATTYSTTAAIPWQSCLLNGIPILTNGVDPPQMWPGQTVSDDLVDLSNWPTGYSCRVIRAYKTYLIALDITDNASNRNPYLLKWSHPADPGSVPSSWDETDPTKDAGEHVLSDNGGFVLDCLPMGDSNIVYRQGRTERMDLVGGVFIFGSKKVFEDTGAMAARCMGAFNRGEGPRHFVATGDDIIVHNGTQGGSVLTSRMRKWLRNQIDSSNYAMSYVVPNLAEKEMWFCFPSVGATHPNLAVVYNINNEALSVRELLGGQECPHISFGAIDTGQVETWDGGAYDVTWDSLLEPWDVDPKSGSVKRLLAADNANTLLMGMDRTNQANGSNFDSFVERTGLAVVGQDRQGNPKVDYDLRKLCTRIWIKASGGNFDVRLGGNDYPDDPVEWEDAQTFDPATDKYLDFIVNKRFLAVRFESSSNVSWEIHSYDLDIMPAGKF